MVLAEKASKIIEASIGMQDSIGDRAAITFSSQFYSSIGFGLSLKKAFMQAKASVSLEDVESGSIPELYVNEKFDPSNIILVK